jgi:hypothetical protein
VKGEQEPENPWSRVRFIFFMDRNRSEKRYGSNADFKKRKKS